MNICSPDKKYNKVNEPEHDKTNKMACAPSEDSYQSRHQSLYCALNGWLGTQGFFVRIAKALIRLGDLSLRWAHRSFCWFCHALAQIIKSILMLQ